MLGGMKKTFKGMIMYTKLPHDENPNDIVDFAFDSGKRKAENT